jgi:hypothetical protein
VFIGASAIKCYAYEQVKLYAELSPARIYRMPEINRLISQAIAANNKLWIEIIDNIFIHIPDCWHQSTCGYGGGDTPGLCGPCEYGQWQQIKKEATE